MAIKAHFPTGVTAIKLDALHQWDYGQQLEIEVDDGLASEVEVHFSCVGMEEAEVRACSVVDGKRATVAIPDLCLEQSAAITAWVYEIVGTSGKTTKKITIPITERTRPSRPKDMSDTVTDLYLQAIGGINAALDSLESLRDGSLVAAEATHARKADEATNATHAVNADTAATALNIEKAKNLESLYYYSFVITMNIYHRDYPETNTGTLTVRLFFSAGDDSRINAATVRSKLLSVPGTCYCCGEHIAPSGTVFTIVGITRFTVENSKDSSKTNMDIHYSDGSTFTACYTQDTTQYLYKMQLC